MKKLFLLLVTFLVINQSSFSKFQWIETQIPNDNPYPGSKPKIKDMIFYKDKIIINNLIYLSITDTNFSRWDYYAGKDFSVINSLCFDELGNIFLATDMGLYKSFDFGKSFKLVNNVQLHKAINRVYFKYGKLYAFAKRELYVSNDYGKSWDFHPLNDTILTSGIVDKALILNDNNIIIMGDQDENFKERWNPQKYYKLNYSSDGGNSWKLLEPEFNDEPIPVRNIFNDKDNNLYIISNKSKEIYKSTNYGDTWDLIYKNQYGQIITYFLPLENGTSIFSVFNMYNSYNPNLTTIYNVNIHWMNENYHDFIINNNLNNDFLFDEIRYYQKTIYAFSSDSSKIFRTYNNFENYNLFRSEIKREYQWNDTTYYKYLVYSFSVYDKQNNYLPELQIIPSVSKGANRIELDKINSQDSTFKVEFSNQIFDFDLLKDQLKFSFEHPDYDNYYTFSFLYQLIDLTIFPSVKEQSENKKFANFSVVLREANISEKEGSMCVFNPILDGYQFYHINLGNADFSYKLPSDIQPGTYNFIFYGYSPNTIFNSRLAPLLIEEETKVSDDRENDIKIFPNPAKNYVIIKNLPADIKNLKIFDINGKVVYQRAINFEPTLLLNLKNINLSKGTYLLLLTNSHRFIYKKLIIN